MDTTDPRSSRVGRVQIKRRQHCPSRLSYYQSELSEERMCWSRTETCKRKAHGRYDTVWNIAPNNPSYSSQNGEERGKVARVAEQNNLVIVAIEHPGNRHFYLTQQNRKALCQNEWSSESPFSEQYKPNLIRDIDRRIRGVPSDVVSLPVSPHGPVVRVRDWRHIDVQCGASRWICMNQGKEQGKDDRREPPEDYELHSVRRERR